jgi:hypothetical protein
MLLFIGACLGAGLPNGWTLTPAGRNVITDDYV